MVPVVRSNVPIHPLTWQDVAGHSPADGPDLDPAPVPVCHVLDPEAISPVPDLAAQVSMASATTTKISIRTISRVAWVEVAACEAVRLVGVAAAEPDQPAWPVPVLVRISALEALMAASVGTEATARWVPAVDADVLPNVANGEEQQDPVRMEPVAEDPDVPCRGNKSDGNNCIWKGEIYLNTFKWWSVP